LKTIFVRSKGTAKTSTKMLISKSGTLAPKGLVLSRGQSRRE
jgi:hypothetical protein